MTKDETNNQSSCQSIGTVKSLVHIPESLKKKDQWGIWAGKVDPKFPDKIQKIARVPHELSWNSSSTNSSHWTTFQAAVRCLERNQRAFDNQFNGTLLEGQYGLAFALFDSDPFVGIDLDSVLDPETGEIQSWAIDAVSLLDTYTEWSPSGTGLRMFVEGEIPFSGRKKGNHATGAVEVYSSGRYLTITGDRFDG